MSKKHDYADCEQEKCFAHKSGKCIALWDNNFKGKPCPFFKTELQIKEEEVYCMRRLTELPEDVQRKIQSKYY